MNVKQALKSEKRSALPALLIKHANFTAHYNSPHPVIITADKDGIFFARPDDMTVGLAFTVDEWNAVVDFVDGQVLEAHEPKDSWKPEWSTIYSEYNYLAADKDGKVYVYENVPEIDGDEWWCANGGDYMQILNLGMPTNLHWKDTLFIRPGL